MAEYCLRWNNHQPNLVTVFSELLNSEALVDVTLASDGQAIQAHRLVLSACSAYFKELFGLNPCAHPIVFLKDIHYEDLKTVIDFIYKGEVNVSQDRLQDVLKTAELLRIKGLADKPFSYDEYSSQSREQRLSSSFSTQRSSLADSKDHVVNTEAEDGIEPRSSPRPSKRRKIASQDSSESQQDSGHDSEDRTRALESKDDRVNLVTIDEDKLKDEPTEPKGSSSIKEEKDTPDRNSDQQESGAVDAMLLLHGSSSETESTIPVGQGASTQSGNNGRENTSLFGSHSQGRGKRAVLKRQPGIVKEGCVEEVKEEIICPEYILPDNVTLTPSYSTMSPMEMFPSEHQNTNSRLLQVPTLVVGSHDSVTISTDPCRHYSKSFLTVPSTSSAQVIRQHSQPSCSGSAGPPQIAKQRSQPSVLTHTPERSHPSKGMSSQDQVTLVPMQMISKQRSFPGNLQTFQTHLRPILPKSFDGENLQMKKAVIHFYKTEEDVLYNTRFTRAVSEEPTVSRNTLGIPSASMPLVQSVSQDTGLDVVAVSSSAPRSIVSIPSITTPTTTVAHTPVLRDGPALGCSFCWNTADKDGRVQRRKTKYHCPDCRSNLCIVPCFHEFHNQMQVKQDQQKQITKILTKTSSM